MQYLHCSNFPMQGCHSSHFIWPWWQESSQGWNKMKHFVQMRLQSRVHGKKALSASCFLAVDTTSTLACNELPCPVSPPSDICGGCKLKTVFCAHMLCVNKPKCFWKHWLPWLLVKTPILEKASCKQNRPWLFTNSEQVLPESLLFISAGVGRCHKNDLKCPEVFYKYCKLSKYFLSHWKPVYLTSTQI